MKGSIIMKKTYIASAFLMAAMVVSMTGCGNNSSVSENTSAGTSAKSAVSDSDETLEKAAKADKTVSENSASVEVKQLSTTTQESTFTERDLEQTADTSEAESIAVADNKTIDITDAGVYTISGSAENCTIRINADDSAKVQLVLDGVSITNDDFPAIYVLSADKVFITTTDSENTLTVSGEFRVDGENNTDAVIYSKDDLVLNGTGTLNVISYYGNGITGKDDMKITGGTYNVKSALDGFEANDSISVCDGTFNVTTKKDGFHCENDEGEGSIAISGGTFTINGASDGIQACAFLQIDGGEFDITAAEGLEATNIVINDGNITINASDDGITMAFLTMSMCEIFHSFNMRSRRQSIFTLSRQNLWLWGSAAMALLLTSVVIEIPALAALFEFTPISLKEYGIAMGLAILIIPIVEIVKAFQRAAARRKGEELRS